MKKIGACSCSVSTAAAANCCCSSWDHAGRVTELFATRGLSWQGIMLFLNQPLLLKICDDGTAALRHRASESLCG
jgi:hypothetical protein